MVSRRQAIRYALTRGVSPSIIHCELTHLERSAIDVDLAAEQHRVYEALLAECGCRILRLAEEPDLPDSVFVEDTAVVVDELGIIARPGADSRKPEIRSVADALRPYRNLVFIEAPGTLDGGDVLCVGKKLYVGRSERTNSEAVDQIREILRPFGYGVSAVDVEGCLHLKSAVTQVDTGFLLVQPEWVDVDRFAGLGKIHVDPEEPFAANALSVGGTVVFPSAFPRTKKRLEDQGIRVQTVDLSELAKAEGAVTCCSIVFNAPGG